MIIATNIHPTGCTLFQGYAHLGSGLTTGLAGLAAGMAIGIIGDAGVRASAQRPKLFTMLLMLIFAGACAVRPHRRHHPVLRGLLRRFG